MGCTVTDQLKLKRQWGALGVTDQLKLIRFRFWQFPSFFPSQMVCSSDRTQLQRHSEVEEPRSSSVNLIVAMDRRAREQWTMHVFIVFGFDDGGRFGLALQL